MSSNKTVGMVTNMLNDGIAYNAIANFLASMDSTLPREVNLANVLHDCWLYGWNWATTDALMAAINDMYVEVSHG